jgi:hypothetical protein
MDSIKGIHYGEEDDETNLLVVAVPVGVGRDGRKSSPNVRRNPSRDETSAIDSGSSVWRLAKRFSDLDSARRGLHRHIYRSRVRSQIKMGYFY